MSNVESPQHYTAGYIEVIYAIHDVLGHEGFKAFCMGNYIKYNARANHKGLKSEDLAKADQYLEWATNGLPAPVNGRVPRPEKPDLYQQLADALAGPQPATDAVERSTAKSAALGVGYAESPFTDDRNPIDPRKSDQTSPNAETVANAIGPTISKLLGNGIFRRIRLRVTKDEHDCPKHGKHIGFTAYVYDREDNDEISRAIILHSEPDEYVCEFVGQKLAEDIKEYLS